MTAAPQTFLGGRVTLHAGDCLDVLDALPADSVDAVITDPPYHFNTIVKRFGGENSAPARHGTDGAFARASAGFMGKRWDGGDIAFRPETWAKVLRVLKPGGHVAAFSAPKCVHRMGIAIELAGFDIRDRVVNLIDPDPALAAFLDSLTPAQADALFRLTDHFGGLGEAFWTFGTGFPKSHDVSKAIDKALGAKRERVLVDAARVRNPKATGGGRDRMDGATSRWIEEALVRGYHEKDGDTPATPQAAQWQGWGTALKPAYEPIVIARKPLSEKSVAAQALATGTGAINIDAGRIGWQSDDDAAAAAAAAKWFADSRRKGTVEQSNSIDKESRGGENTYDPHALAGRWPANLTHDGAECVLTRFPETKSGTGAVKRASSADGNGNSGVVYGAESRSSGAVMACIGDSGSASRFFYSAKADKSDRLGSGHPTVKPIDLMQWLVRMLTPPGGVILDPFAGTGTTGEAAWREGFSALLIEREAEYRADIARRMDLAAAGPSSRRAGGAKAKAERKGVAPLGGLFGGGEGGNPVLSARFMENSPTNAAAARVGGGGPSARSD